MRWNEETNFRELKYTIGLINWHSNNYDGILQEIAARLLLYNFCELVTAHAVIHQTAEKVKHVYKINFATAVNIYRAYLKNGGDETATMFLILIILLNVADVQSVFSVCLKIFFQLIYNANFFTYSLN